MQAATQMAPVSQKKLWAGRIISALPALLLIFSGIMKIMRPPSVMQGFAHAGIPESHAIPIGILEIFCAVVYLIPRTTVLGAILMTAYLGGATATNVRVGDSATVITVLLGVLVWIGLYLRDERLRPLLPLRSCPPIQAREFPQN
ncbi:MAG TPA: DoxX family protein [Terriglobales bacterium]|nr:DoxX family protein [Terriglobales bacterium]